MKIEFEYHGLVFTTLHPEEISWLHPPLKIVFKQKKIKPVQTVLVSKIFKNQKRKREIFFLILEIF